MKKTFVFVWVLGVIIAPLCAGNIVKNSGFENDWLSWKKGGRAKINWALSDKVVHSGKKSLHVRNESTKAPNVFGTISQKITVKPNTKYIFSIWIKTENAKNIWFVGGKGWRIRKHCPNGIYDWKKISVSYKTQKNEKTFVFRINFDGKSENVWIDDICIEEVKKSKQ